MEQHLFAALHCISCCPVFFFTVPEFPFPVSAIVHTRTLALSHSFFHTLRMLNLLLNLELMSRVKYNFDMPQPSFRYQMLVVLTENALENSTGYMSRSVAAGAAAVGAANPAFSAPSTSFPGLPFFGTGGILEDGVLDPQWKELFVAGSAASTRVQPSPPPFLAPPVPSPQINQAAEPPAVPAPSANQQSTLAVSSSSSSSSHSSSASSSASSSSSSDSSSAAALATPTPAKQGERDQMEAFFCLTMAAVLANLEEQGFLEDGLSLSHFLCFEISILLSFLFVFLSGQRCFHAGAIQASKRPRSPLDSGESSFLSSPPSPFLLPPLEQHRFFI